jgi:hypothetical protein
MVDVVVDAKELAKRPYDPNDIPESVRKRAAAVDALYQNGGAVAAPVPVPGQVPDAASADGGQPAVEQPQPPPVQPATVPAPAPAVGEPTALDDDANSNTWKSRALSLQGRFNKEVGELQNQITQLGQELLHVQNQQRRPSQRPQRPAPAYLTPEDEQNYGRELLDVAQRAALHVVEPKLQNLEAQNKELRRRQAQDQRRIMDQQVELAVPDFREIDRNPRWHRWLLGVDVLSGRVRQTLLDEAISAGAAPRVISFFNGFKQEEAATGHSEPAPFVQPTSVPRTPAIPLASLATPGRARPATGGETSLPSEKPVYTRAQIRDLYRAHQKGAYVGREAEWARQDLDIIAAGREGRIR